MSRCPRRFSRLVERAFVRGLSARQRRQLRDHLATCPTCQERWERLATIDRVMGGPTLSPQMIDDIENAVVPSRGWPSWMLWSGGGGLATVALLVLVVVWGRDERSRFAPRGGGGGARTAGLRLFCIDRDRDHVQSAVAMVSSGPRPELRCTIDADLQLAYSTPDREGLTMVAFGRMNDSILPYAPPVGVGDMLPLRADRIDQVVDWSTRLAVHHRPGRYEVIARFFDHPVSVADAIDGRISPITELKALLDVVPAPAAGSAGAGGFP